MVQIRLCLVRTNQVYEGLHNQLLQGSVREWSFLGLEHGRLLSESLAIVILLDTAAVFDM